ncbi:MAG: sulfatase [Byssovorax sp.]
MITPLLQHPVGQSSPRARRITRIVLALLAAPAGLSMACGGQSSPSSSAGGEGGQSPSGTQTVGAGGQPSSSSSGVGGSSQQTSGTGGGGAPAGQANVIFVLTDDLSMNLVQFMPHVLQMQKDGATFSNYFVADSLCCPSRTSMFTGKLPHNSGVFTNQGADGGYATYLSQGNDAQTFATALSAGGYRTAMMGKFLNGYDANANDAAAGWTEWDVTDNGYKGYGYPLNINGTVVPHGSADADFLTDVLSGLGQTFVGDPSAKPFLIELAPFSPHSPYASAPRHANLFPNLKYPHTPSFNAAPAATDPDWLKPIPALTPAQIKSMDTIYAKRARAVQSIDEMIGALQKQLVASGHDKDTYIFFTSDNGYHLGEHRQMPGKMTAFDTDIHVPLIVTGPGVPAGLTIDNIAQNIDLCSTFAEIGETPPPGTVNGHSLVALLHGQTVAGWRDVAMIEHHDPKFDPADPDQDSGVVINPPTYAALRTVDQVYVEYVGGETEFHDRKTDPFELKNTAAGLSAGKIMKFHDTLAAIKACTTVDTCWAAQHLKP